MAGSIQIDRQAALATVLGDDALLLRSVSIRESLGRPFSISAQVLSASSEKPLVPKVLIGTNATIRLHLPHREKPRFWNGQVIDLDYVGHADDLPLYRLTIAPRLNLLGRTADFRAVQGKTVPDIVRAVFKDQGLDDVKFDLHEQYQPWDFCAQYRETDLNFVSRLLEQEGIYYYFTHVNGKHTLVLTDDVATHKPAATYETLQWRPGGGGSEDDSEYITDLTLNYSVQPDTYQSADYDFRTPRKLLRASAKLEVNHAAGSFDVFDFPGEWDKDADGEQFTKVRLQELQAQREVFSGSTNARGLCAGAIVRISDHPNADLNRSLLLTSVDLSVQNNDYRGGGERGSVFHCHFTGIDAKTQFRSPRAAPKPVVQGPQTAVVVGPAGSEIHTDEYGRVKVQFHWDRYGQANEKSSFWCRVAQAWAGKNWGAIFIPRIGMEVIVSFLEGDPDQPLVTGCVYNGENLPPYKLPDHATRSTIKTNSSTGGGGFNELRFEDKKDAEQLFINAQKLMDVRVGDTRQEYVGNERHLVIEKDQYEWAKLNKHSIVKADAYSTIEGTFNGTVKGDVLTQVDGTEHHTVKTERRVKISGDDSLNVSGALNLKTGTTVSLNAGTDIHVKSGTAVGIQGGTTVYVKAGMSLVIEAGAQLSLKVGGNFIDISPAGVSIQGTMVMINSGGAAGAGSPPSPVAPVDPDAPDPAKEAKLADSDKPGQVTKTAPTPPPRTTPGPAAAVLIQGSKSAAPFCAQCAKIAAERDAAAKKADDEDDEKEDVAALEDDDHPDPKKKDDEKKDDEKRSPAQVLADDILSTISNAVTGKGVDEKAAMKLVSNGIKAVGDRLEDALPKDKLGVKKFVCGEFDKIAEAMRSGNVGNLHRQVAGDAIDAVGKTIEDRVGGDEGKLMSGAIGIAAGEARGEDSDGEKDDDDKDEDGKNDGKKDAGKKDAGKKPDSAAAAKQLIGKALGMAFTSLTAPPK